MCRRWSSQNKLSKRVKSSVVNLWYFNQTVNKLGYSDVIFYFLKKHYLWYIIAAPRLAVCALCADPSLSLFLFLSHTNTHTHTHNSNASGSNFAFKSCGLTQRGSVPPHTSCVKGKSKRHKEPSHYSMGRKLILSVLPLCVWLQWGPTACVAFVSLSHSITDGLCVCII